MSDSQDNLQGQAALEKIKEISKHVRACQMLTALDKRPICSRPMGIQEIDEMGRMIFMSHKNSNKNREINASNEVQLIFSNDSDIEYMSLFGHAEIYRDQKVIDRVYDSFADNWFEGKEDPNITLIRFTPSDGRYCDTKHGKIVQLAGMLVGAITGKNKSDSVEGKISV
ncbi:MAG TPA: pyridoxamine 5'-phosphate oxidase family protein [Bacteroidia bacterium]|jgi:general stress protein 26|nr:pyridoxamine 5'-phosphate oxidase family protein [Bacteroidia bacterium]